MSVLFNGTQLSSWSSQQKQAVSGTPRIREVANPPGASARFAGVTCLAFEIQAADVDPAGTPDQRSEVLWGSDSSPPAALNEGQRYYMADSIWLPTGFPIPFTPTSASTGHCLFNQLKKGTGSPQYSLDIQGHSNVGYFQDHYGDKAASNWSPRVQSTTGEWHDLIIDLTIGQTATNGALSIWHAIAGNALVNSFPRIAIATAQGTTNYAKLGYYRKKGNVAGHGAGDTTTGIVYHSKPVYYSTLQEAKDHFGASTAPPVSAFTFAPNNGVAPVTVAFNSGGSTGTGLAFLWTGTGWTSTAANPTHLYSSPGTDQVSLRVTDNQARQHTSTQIVTVTSVPAPVALTSLQAVRTGNSAALSWTDPADANRVGIWVYRRVAGSGGVYSRVGSVLAASATTATDATLSGTVDYEYVVRGINSVNVEGPDSNIATAPAPPTGRDWDLLVDDFLTSTIDTSLWASKIGTPAVNGGNVIFSPIGSAPAQVLITAREWLTAGKSKVVGPFVPGAITASTGSVVYESIRMELAANDDRSNRFVCKVYKTELDSVGKITCPVVTNSVEESPVAGLATFDLANMSCFRWTVSSDGRTITVESGPSRGGPWALVRTFVPAGWNLGGTQAATLLVGAQIASGSPSVSSTLLDSVGIVTAPPPPSTFGVARRPDGLVFGDLIFMHVAVGNPSSWVSNMATLPFEDFLTPSGDPPDLGVTAASTVRAFAWVKRYDPVTDDPVANGTGVTTNASNSVTGATGTWLKGQNIYGAGIPTGTIVGNVAGTTLTLIKASDGTASNATASATVPLTSAGWIIQFSAATEWSIGTFRESNADSAAPDFGIEAAAIVADAAATAHTSGAQQTTLAGEVWHWLVAADLDAVAGTWPASTTGTMTRLYQGKEPTGGVDIAGYAKTFSAATAFSDTVTHAASCAAVKISFQTRPGQIPTTKPNVTGSRGGNAALASLLTSLAGLGLITDGSS